MFVRFTILTVTTGKKYLYKWKIHQIKKKLMQRDYRQANDSKPI